mmetsp:Transcript_15659/g.35464  ORF Transcript_15659/g.35464 Transcript_15659/m.35464 type:complete len:252 (+) Transcript_15659:1874-2629(+)
MQSPSLVFHKALVPASPQRLPRQAQPLIGVLLRQENVGAEKELRDLALLIARLLKDLERLLGSGGRTVRVHGDEVQVRELVQGLSEALLLRLGLEESDRLFACAHSLLQVLHSSVNVRHGEQGLRLKVGGLHFLGKGERFLCRAQCLLGQVHRELRCRHRSHHSSHAGLVARGPVARKLIRRPLPSLLALPLHGVCGNYKTQGIRNGCFVTERLKQRQGGRRLLERILAIILLYALLGGREEHGRLPLLQR